MNVIAMIPARMASTRFPNKPLAPILGLPMIEHVRRRVKLSRLVDEAIVATCDEAIREVVERAGGRALMTSDRHERCTDRIAEAATAVSADVIVNVQGDEPLISPGMIEALVTPLLSDSSLLCTNLMTRITTDVEFRDYNAVKVVVDGKGDALYFSREPIPSSRHAGGGEIVRWKQLGIIAFRGDFLQEFAKLAPTPLEKAESVDMLRAVEHGFPVRMVETTGTVVGVDVPGDVAKAEQLLRVDSLVREYLSVDARHDAAR